MADDDSKKPDYEVGYGRPPKHTQFPHQKMGAGPRKRKQKTMRDYLLEELHGTMSLRDPKTGMTRKVKTAQQIARNYSNKAALSDHKAVGIFLGLEGGGSSSRGGEEPPSALETLSRDDKAIMARFARKYLAAQQKQEAAAEHQTTTDETNIDVAES